MINTVSPWYRSYPEGMPESVDVHRHESLVDLVEESMKTFGPLPAFDCMGTSISFHTLDRLSRNFAAFLQVDLGLKPGSRVAIQMPNLLQYPIAMLGILRAGMIVVNINPLYTPREMKHQLVDAGAEAIVILANFAHHLEAILTETSLKHVIVTEVGDQLGRVKKVIVNSAAKHVRKMVPKYRLPNAISFNRTLRTGAGKTFSRPAICYDDTAFIQYTGGTTGVSKGAILSHGNILANIEQFLTWLKPAGLQEGDEIIITALPLYHIMALMGNCFTMMQIGVRNVLIPNARDMKGFIKEMKRYPFSLFSGVNTLYNGLMNHPDFDSIDFSHLRFSGAGGMSVQSAVASRWKEKTGVPISEGYGLTETSPILTFNIPGCERVGSVGLPVPGTELMIANEYDKKVPVGEPGEIYAKGPQVMKEYWNQPEESRNAFTKAGWFKTGDIGVMDENGFFYIVDRKKEMILVSGFNVYPNEVEEVVASHEKVLEAGVVGIPDAYSTEAVKVYVVKKDDSLTYEELLSYCRNNLTGYKCPKQIEFRQELPKTSIGKILRRELKEVKL